MISPAEPSGDRPIDEEGFADDILGRKRSPGARVGTVAGVVAHDHVGVIRVVENGFRVGEIWRQVRIKPVS